MNCQDNFSSEDYAKYAKIICVNYPHLQVFCILRNSLIKTEWFSKIEIPSYHNLITIDMLSDMIVITISLLYLSLFCLFMFYYYYFYYFFILRNSYLETKWFYNLEIPSVHNPIATDKLSNMIFFSKYFIKVFLFWQSIFVKIFSEILW